MLGTLAIVSNQIVLSFGVLIAFWSPKQIWDRGEFFGIHTRSIPGQGVRIYHRKASGQHIRIGCYRFIQTTFHSGRNCTQMRTAILAPGCRALSTPRCSHSEFWRRMGEEAFQLLRTDISGSSDSRLPGWGSSHSAQCCCVLLKLPAISDRHLKIFATDILGYFALDIWCLNPQTLLVIHLS